MRFASFALITASLVGLVPAFAIGPHIHRGPTSPRIARQRSSVRPASHPTVSGMDSTRATQIQTALVKAGYLNETSGTWDSTSQAAMQKMQADNGWQSKFVPDARALQKLGLGTSGTANAPEARATESAEAVSEPAATVPANQ